MRVTFRGREIRNPFIRIPLAIAIIVLGTAGALLAILLLPATIPLHGLFRLCGRRGFFYVKPGDRGITYAIGLGAFCRPYGRVPAARVFRRF